MEELMYLLRRKFEGVAIITQASKNRIELEVSTNLNKFDWKERMKEFKSTDNIVPDSWEYNGIRIVLFGGKIKNEKKINITY